MARRGNGLAWGAAEVWEQAGLAAQDRSVLERVASEMPIVADLSRADLLVFGPSRDGRAPILAQARPHSVPPVHSQLLAGQWLRPSEAPALFSTLRTGRPSRVSHGGMVKEGAPVAQEVYPIRTPEGRIIGVLSQESNLIDHERQRRRAKPFQRAVAALRDSLLKEGLAGAADLSPFGEHDGVLFIDVEGHIQYASGIVSNLYRRAGHQERLLQRAVGDLGTTDAQFLEEALRLGRCLEREVREAGRVWIKKVLPVRQRRGLLASEPRLIGHLIAVHDATDRLHKEQELKIKSAMIQEIHHRVKNNLQTVASLIRLQARRVDSSEAQRILQEAINRILSIAYVHEYLSEQDARSINMREVCESILSQLMQGLVGPDRGIHGRVTGPAIRLSPQQATAVALVLNELLQNAVQHGYASKREGLISVRLEERDAQVTIRISDDGGGLPVDFDLSKDSSLGLRIVQTLVYDDLKGSFELHDEDAGVAAVVSFARQPTEVTQWPEDA